jgi:hypothetical protein
MQMQTSKIQQIINSLQGFKAKQAQSPHKYNQSAEPGVCRVCPGTPRPYVKIARSAKHLLSHHAN